MNNYQEERNGKITERVDLAFSPEGIMEMNTNITSLNNGKPHAPIYKVRTYEVKGNRFAVGEKGTKDQKFVIAAKGTNLFFAVYWNEEKQKRTYETIPLNEVIAHQKWRAALPEAERQKTPMIPVKNETGTFLFSLSPNDLVYVPEVGEQVNFEVLNPKNIYKTVSFTGNQCFFIRNDIATSIVNKAEFSALNKMEKSIEGTMIKETCIKLQADRLGNIKPANPF